MNRGLRGMGAVLAVSAAVTQGLLLWQGRWQEALPLHLCSLSAIAALLAVFAKSRFAVDFLWYLGLPGALLALLFPAPALSRIQPLLNTSYVTTHLMLVCIPLAFLRTGEHPRCGRVLPMMGALQGIALLAFLVNMALGTDFLFLMAPPAGTPLEAVYALGYPAYLLALEGMMLALCSFQGVLLARIARR